jgi:UDP-2,3-diacylglucosamine pyrophosphatase LpxH
VPDVVLKILWPDTHHHHHDRRAVEVLLQVIATVEPDEVCILGDFLDMKAPARWSRGKVDEFVADLLVEAEAACNTLAALRQAQGTRRIVFLPGNHDIRIQRYIDTVAPALKGVVRDYPDLLMFENFDVIHAGVAEGSLQADPYKVAPGTLAIHGELLSSTQQAAGQSAYKERHRLGRSIVQGHTHRLGLGWDTQERDRFWMECGHLKDVQQATYLSYVGQANWQQGFGALHIDGKAVFPTIHKITKGITFFDGKRYKA